MLKKKLGNPEENPELHPEENPEENLINMNKIHQHEDNKEHI